MATKYRLLLVDDEADLREILKDEFESEGFHVVEASSGREALQKILQEPIDIVVSDIRMPELTGIDLLDALREKDPKIPPVILITGFADITNDEAYAKGAHAIFAKPFDIVKITECVKLALTPEAQRLKKRDKRLPVHLAVELKLPSLESLSDAKILNIGNGGIFVASQGPLPNPGDLVSFRFNFEGTDQTIEGTGYCRWVRENSDTNLPPGFGVEFQEISEDTFVLVREHLKKFPTKSHIPRS
jgi:CheY-like chemotaxis protein